MLCDNVKKAFEARVWVFDYLSDKNFTDSSMVTFSVQFHYKARVGKCFILTMENGMCVM